MTEQESQSPPGGQARLGTCYALVLYTYDHYEWEQVYAVSFDHGRLRVEYDALDDLYSDRSLVTEALHKEYANLEIAHWTIEPIKFLS